MPTYPPSTSHNTWLATADSVGGYVFPTARSATKIQFLIINPDLGTEEVVQGYFQNLKDVTRFSSPSTTRPYFLVTRQGSYKADGDLFTCSDYSVNTKAPARTQLKTYLTPAIQSRMSQSFGTITNNVFKSIVSDAEKVGIHTKHKISNSIQKPAKDSPVFASQRPQSWAQPEGPRPALYSVAPMPHWAMHEFDKATDAGNGVPEIMQPGYIRIGAVSMQNAVGPIDLQISQSSQVASLPTIRQGQTMKRVSGNIRKTVEFTMQFPSAVSIAQELIPLIRQSRHAPFVPVIHQELYDADIDALAIESIVVSTVPGFPEVLQAQIRAYQFNWRRYMLDAEEFDLCFNYPLLDIWLAKLAVPKNAYSLSIPDLSTGWDSTLQCYVPSRDWLDLVNDNATDTDTAAVKKAFSSPKDPRINLLYRALSAIETGDTSLIPKLKQGDKLIGPVIVKAFESHFGIQIVSEYVAIPLVSQSLQESAFAPVDKKGADIILVNPKIIPDSNNTGTAMLDNQTAQEESPVGTSARTAQYTELVDNKNQLAGGYWGLWKVGRKLSLPTPPGQVSDVLDSPLGLAAQDTFLDPSHPVYLPVPEFEGLVLQGVTVQMSNLLAEFSPSDEETPVFQHMGAADTSIVFEGICPEPTARLLEDFFREVAKLAVDYRGQWNGSAYGGYCYLSNEIANICSLTTAVPVSLSVDTVPNYPSERRVSLTFASFDQKQRQRNVPSDFGYTTDGSPDGNSNKISDTTAVRDYNDQTLHSMQNGDLETHVQAIKLYPDLDLPTWDELHHWVSALTASGGQKVWDYKKGKPHQGFEFLQYWAYAQDYWPHDPKANTTHETKGAKGYITCLDTPSISGAHAYADCTSPSLIVLDSAGQEVPGGKRGGYADPDFYCASRGDARRPTGYDRINKGLIGSLRGSNGAQPQKSLYWGSDGLKMTTQWGTKEASIIPDAASVKAMDVHLRGTYVNGDPNGDRSILSIPTGVSKGNKDKEMDNQGSAPAPAADSGNPNANLPSGGGSTPYPTYGGKYLDQIRKASATYHIPVALIQSIIHAESGGDPTQITHGKGGAAYGIMQFWIDSGSAVPPGITDSDPTIGLKNGCEELARHIKKYPGDVKKAILAFRGGDGAVDQAAGIAEKQYYSPKLLSEMLHYQTKVYADFQRLDNNTDLSDPNQVPPTEAEIKAYNDITNFGSTPYEAITHTLKLGLATSPVGFLLNSAGIKNDIGALLAERAGASAQDEAEKNKSTQDIRDWDIDRATYDPEYGEDIFYALRRAECSGRLLQAFPSYLILLVDGGTVQRIWRLSDVFYGLHSAMSINVFASRKVAADTAVVTFADPFNNLSSVAADIQIAKQSDTRTNNEFQITWGGILSALHIPTEDEANRRVQDLKSLLIKAGSRLHIRLGFGSDASQLPIVFNGVISSVRRKSDVIELTSLGDGAELTNLLSPTSPDQGKYVSAGSGASGVNMRNMILDFFTATEADLLAQQHPELTIGGLAPEMIERISDGFFLGGNPYGIVHFGSPSRDFFVTDAGEIGPNIYSGWSESPVNVTYANEDWPIVANLLPGIYNGIFEDIPQTVLENSDKLLGRYTGDGFARNMDTVGMWRRFNGEPIVGLCMENATPWDVISTLRYVATDYIRIVEPFGLRSTLFFGKSYWPLHYRYNFEDIQKVENLQLAAGGGSAAPPLTDAPPEDDRPATFFETYRDLSLSGITIFGNPSALVKPIMGFIGGLFTPTTNEKGVSILYGDTMGGDRGSSPKDSYEVVFRRRPYLQVHIAHSGTNLLASEIEAQDETWSSVVQSLGTTTGLGGDNMESSYAQFADSEIFPEFQRQKVVKSGLYSSVDMRIEDTIYSLGSSIPLMSTNILNNHAVGVLHDEVKEMYQGDIVTFGNGWVRPFHLLHLDDNMKKMTGMVEIKEVLHSLTPEGGFTTTMSPDCLCTAADQGLPVLWGHAKAVTGRLLIGNQIMKLVTTSGGRHLLRRVTAKIMGGVANIDDVFSKPIGHVAKLTEYNASKWSRRKWRSTYLGKAVQTKARLYQDAAFSPFGIPVKDAAKYIPQRQDIRDEFERQIKLRESHGGVTVRKGAISNLAEFKRGERINESLYNDIHKDMLADYGRKAVAARKAEAHPKIGPPALMNRKKLREALLKTIDDALKHGNPIDKEGNLIEHDSLMRRAKNWIDPYHGEGGMGRDLQESWRQGRSFRWGASTPKAQAQLDPDVLAHIEEISRTEDLANQARSLGIKNQQATADEIKEALRLSSVKGSSAKKGAAEQMARLEQKIKNQQAVIEKARVAKKAARGVAAIKKAQFALYIEQEKLKALTIVRIRAARVTGDVEARILAQRTMQDIPMQKLIHSVLEIYGKVPGVSADSLKVLEEQGLYNAARGVDYAAEAVRTAADIKAGIKIEGAGAKVLKFGCKVGDLAVKMASLGLMSGLTSLDRYLMSRHALHIVPLTSCGREFTAGVNGHRGLIAGDTLGAMDSLISYFCDETASPPLLRFLTGMLGVHVNYQADPTAYAGVMEGLGMQTTLTPDQSASNYEAHLAHYRDMNVLGFNFKTANFVDDGSTAGGANVPTTTPQALSTIKGHTDGVNGFALAVTNVDPTSIITDKVSETCANFVSKVFQRAGLAIPTENMARGLRDKIIAMGGKSHTGPALPGDLIYYSGGRYTQGGRSGHVGYGDGAGGAWESSRGVTKHNSIAGDLKWGGPGAKAEFITVPGSTFA